MIIPSTRPFKRCWDESVIFFCDRQVEIYTLSRLNRGCRCLELYISTTLIREVKSNEIFGRHFENSLIFTTRRRYVFSRRWYYVFCARRIGQSQAQLTKLYCLSVKTHLFSLIQKLWRLASAPPWPPLCDAPDLTTQMPEPLEKCIALLHQAKNVPIIQFHEWIGGVAK